MNFSLCMCEYVGFLLRQSQFVDPPCIAIRQVLQGFPSPKLCAI